MENRDVNLKNKSIHLMGIGGAGMSGLALLLDQIGCKVSGCDAVKTSYVKHLEERNIPVIIGHEAKHIDEFMPNVLVYSSAIPNDHPEILKAWQQGIQVSRRAEVLSQIFNVRRGVGVAGTHGKTTTSSMISLIAEEAGADPTIAIGGDVLQIGTNAKLGQSDYMVAELDESDRSFVYFHPEISVITNIDWDHRDHYMTFKSVTDAFAEVGDGRLRRIPLEFKARGKNHHVHGGRGHPPPARRIRREGHDRDLRLGPHVELGRGGSVAPRGRRRRLQALP